MEFALLLATGLTLGMGCRSSFGQPDRVVRRFYGAAIAGDLAAARECLARQTAPDVKRIVETATRDGALVRVAIERTNVWAEHGAVCEVRKHLANGATERIRVEVVREAGDWRIVSGSPSL